MKDRIPTPGKENRVRITQDNGQVIEGVFEYADDATQEGSFYNKANVLPDEVCDYLHIDGKAAEPKDAWLAMGKIVFDNFSNGLFAPKKKSTAPLFESRAKPLATANQNYMIYAGGSSATKVEAYDHNLVRTVASDLSVVRSSEYGTAATLENYCFFAGTAAWKGTGGGTLDVYNENLIKIAVSDLPGNRIGPVSAAVGNYLIIAGGYDGSDYVKTVYAYDKNLVQTTVANLTNYKARAKGANTENYAVIGGWNQSTAAEVYNKNLIHSGTVSFAAFSERAAFFSFNNTVVSAGGYAGNITAIVQRLDNSLVLTACPELSTARTYPGGAANNCYCIIAGGHAGNLPLTTVDIYDVNFVHTVGENLTTGGDTNNATYSINSCSIGGYIAFLGTIAEVYYSGLIANIEIPPFCAYNFEEVTDGEQITLKTTEIVSEMPLTGYIRKICKLSGNYQ